MGFLGGLGIGVVGHKVFSAEAIARRQQWQRDESLGVDMEQEKKQRHAQHPQLATIDHQEQLQALRDQEVTRWLQNRDPFVVHVVDGVMNIGDMLERAYSAGSFHHRDAQPLPTLLQPFLQHVDGLTSIVCEYVGQWFDALYRFRVGEVLEMRSALGQWFHVEVMKIVRHSDRYGVSRIDGPLVPNGYAKIAPSGTHLPPINPQQQWQRDQLLLFQTPDQIGPTTALVLSNRVRSDGRPTLELLTSEGTTRSVASTISARMLWPFRGTTYPGILVPPVEAKTQTQEALEKQRLLLNERIRAGRCRRPRIEMPRLLGSNEVHLRDLLRMYTTVFDVLENELREA